MCTRCHHDLHHGRYTITVDEYGIPIIEAVRGPPQKTVQEYTSIVIESISIETKTTWPESEQSVSLLQAVADPVRWTVVARLARGTACVCELQEHFDIAPNLLSYHLKVLRDNGLVTTSRRGRWVDYSLAADAMSRIREALPGGD